MIPRKDRGRWVECDGCGKRKALTKYSELIHSCGGDFIFISEEAPSQTDAQRKLVAEIMADIDIDLTEKSEALRIGELIAWLDTAQAKAPRGRVFVTDGSGGTLRPIRVDYNQIAGEIHIVCASSYATKDKVRP